MAQNLADVLAALGVLGALPSPATGDMSKLVVEWANYLKETLRLDMTPSQLKAWSVRLSTLISKPDRAQELQLLEEACENPLLGLTLVLACMPGTAARQAQRWWNLVVAEQSVDLSGNDVLPGWNIKELPAPAPETKYLIISDLHRDAASDDRGPLKSGSIDHFKVNSQLYERILDFAIEKNYTLLEGGDCEELWFVRSLQDYPRKPDRSLDIAAKLQDIINSHPGVYRRLRQLHNANRYFRIYGNHDSFLKPAGVDHSVGQVLKAEMERNGGSPFAIYDAFIIDGVKTMMEQDGGDLLADAASLVAGQKTPKQFLEKLLFGRLGLDSNDYTKKCRMLVTHGHQFDVWNSPENEILGLLIANTVASFVDRHMDPFLDLRGVASEGNPLINFGDLFARWPVFDSWPAKQAAIRFAHQVQHMPNATRALSDSIMFSESFAALYGTFGIALNYRVDQNTKITPKTSRDTLNLKTPTGVVEYLERHHFHHLCIGHTHNPQSQPYITLENLAKLAVPLAPVINLIKALLPGFLEPQLKTMYFNSGTAGWMEGVIWGIEIDEKGQARLVFWTEKSTSLEYMDWELQPLPKEVKDHLLDGVETAFGAPLSEIGQHLEGIYAKLRERLAAFNVSPQAIASALSRAASLPIYTLALALMSKPPQEMRLWQLQEVPSGLQRKIEQLRQQYDRLRNFTFDVLLSVKRRALSGFASDSETERCVIQAPISSAVRARLEQFKRILMQMDMSEDQALHYAALALSAFHEFPRNLPFFSSLVEPLNQGARLDDSQAPVLQALLSTLWMYPPAGQTVEVQGVSLQSRFELYGENARLTVTLAKSTGPNA